jgi:integral membrane protein
MQPALRRYRVIAYVVGVLLLVLVGIAMPLKYFADRPLLVELIGPAHGFLYMVYLVLTFDLARRAGWALSRTVLFLLAGTVPVASFVAERRATRLVNAGRTVQDGQPAGDNRVTSSGR